MYIMIIAVNGEQEAVTAGKRRIEVISSDLLNNTPDGQTQTLRLTVVDYNR